MNIAIFASAFHPSLGGVEELCRQLAQQLKRRDMGVIVVTNQWPRGLPASEILAGIPVYRVPMRVPDGARKAHVNYHLTHRFIRRRIRRIIASHRIDILHVQCVSANGFYALEVAEKLHLPLLVTLQGELTMDENDLFQRSPFARNLLRTLAEKADAITACSRQTLEEARDFLGHDFKQSAEPVYNGIQLADWVGVEPYQRARPYIFCLGRLVPQKGFDILLKAFSRLVSTGNTTHDIILAGEGEQKESLMRLAEELGIAERVQFYGLAERHEVESLFKGCEFFVLPSRHEPFGIVNLEAMAAGKAVVASRVGGVPEIVRHGENGLLFPAGDDAALAAQLAQLIEQPALRQKLGAKGTAIAREFDWSHVTDSYVRIYRSLAARPSRVAPA